LGKKKRFAAPQKPKRINAVALFMGGKETTGTG